MIFIFILIALKNKKLIKAYSKRTEGNHKMKGTFPQPEVIPDLTRPNFGDKDNDVAVTQSNIDLAEGMH